MQRSGVGSVQRPSNVRRGVQHVDDDGLENPVRAELAGPPGLHCAEDHLGVDILLEWQSTHGNHRHPSGNQPGAKCMHNKWHAIIISSSVNQSWSFQYPQMKGGVREKSKTRKNKEE